MHAILCCWFLLSSKSNFGNYFSTLAVLDWVFCVCCCLCLPSVYVCVCLKAQWMKRDLYRSDIIFTMQKICQVFHCPFSCVCPLVSFLGLRLFLHFPLLSLLGLVRSALGSSPIEQRSQEKRMHAYHSEVESEVWRKQSRWLDIYTFLLHFPCRC